MSDIMRQTKGWFLGAGIILIILGAVAISVPLAVSIAVEILFGWIFVLSGVVTIIHSFRALNSGKCILRLLIGIAYLAIGIMFLMHPMQGVLTLTLLLAILFAFQGITQVAVALRLRPLPNWGWMLVSGIAALILAAIIFSGYPGNVAWILGLLVGINLIFSGWTMLMLSSAVDTA
ncbi:MAG: HdeD family acid-resistance protein [Candidatus Omnitrophica bacterium]|nr:HdeD family acid-resistance protein [Candidatus Omnitrophota bacterium]